MVTYTPAHEECWKIPEKDIFSDDTIIVLLVNDNKYSIWRKDQVTEMCENISTVYSEKGVDFLN